MVVIAVCTLTLSVVTRYSVPGNAASLAGKIVRTAQTPLGAEAKRQRLAKGAPLWATLIVFFGGLRPPTFYPKVSPAEPALTIPCFHQCLYNRPPPFSELLS